MPSLEYKLKKLHPDFDQTQIKFLSKNIRAYLNNHEQMGKGIYQSLVNNATKLYNRFMKKKQLNTIKDGETHQILLLPDGSLQPAKYSGPGSDTLGRIKKDLKEGKKIFELEGLTPTDTTAQAHDLRYYLANNSNDIRHADLKMITALGDIEHEGRDSKFNTTVSKVMQAKILLEQKGWLSRDKFASKDEKRDPEDEKLAEEVLAHLEMKGYGCLWGGAKLNKIEEKEILNANNIGDLIKIYKKFALKYHPDKLPNDKYATPDFQEILNFKDEMVDYLKGKKSYPPLAPSERAISKSPQPPRPSPPAQGTPQQSPRNQRSPPPNWFKGDPNDWRETRYWNQSPPRDIPKPKQSPPPPNPNEFDEDEEVKGFSFDEKFDEKEDDLFENYAGYTREEMKQFEKESEIRAKQEEKVKKYEQSMTEEEKEFERQGREFLNKMGYGKKTSPTHISMRRELYEQYLQKKFLEKKQKEFEEYKKSQMKKEEEPDDDELVAIEENIKATDKNIKEVKGKGNSQGQSKWVKHIKAVQKKLGISYKDAMKEASKTYKK